MMNRLFVLCGLLMLVASAAAFAAAQPTKQVLVSAVTACELHTPDPLIFTRGTENCSLLQARQLYMLFSNAVQDVEEDEFSVEIPYDIGICADRRWIHLQGSNEKAIYCWNSCECTENGNSCHAECAFL